jgi:heme exporter protein D
MTFKWLNYSVTLVKVISMDLDSIKSKTKFWLTVLTAQILQDLLFSLRNMCNKKQLRKLKIT